MRNTAKLDDITWVMLFDAGVNVDNVHRYRNLYEYVAYSEDRHVKVTFGPSFDPIDRGDDAEGNLGWDVQVSERVDDDWVESDYESFPTAREVVAYVAEALGYTEGGQS